MPNTKSAERRTRSNERKHVRNTHVKSRLKTLEKSYLASVSSGKSENSESALRLAISAMDKAAKGGVIHKRTADRKKSRLSLRLNRAVAAAKPAEAAK